MLRQCCGNATCWQIQHDKQPVSDLQKLLSVGEMTSSIVYPILVDVQDTSPNTVGLIPTSGVAFVVPKGKSQSYPMKLLQSVFDAWPVLILTFLLSVLAGIFLWAMVRSIMNYNVDVLLRLNGTVMISMQFTPLPVLSALQYSDLLCTVQLCSLFPPSDNV